MHKNKRNKSSSATDQAEEHSRKRRRQSTAEAGGGGEESVSNTDAQRLLDTILTRKEKGRLIHKDFRILPDKESYPDYYDEIDNPISLDDIEDRVSNDTYPSLDAVKKDLELMCQNALIYYKVSHSTYKDAQIIQQIVRDFVSSSRRNAAAPVVESNRSSTLPDGPPSADVNNRMLDVIDALINLEDSSGVPVYEDFRNLVKRKEYPEYYRIIKTPMSLNTVRTRVLKGKYPTWDDMKRELDIIITNAQTFNEEGSEIYDLANELRDHIDQFLDCGRSGKSLPVIKPVAKPVKEEEPEQRPAIQQRPSAPQRPVTQSRTPNLSNGHSVSQNGSYNPQSTSTPVVPPTTLLSSRNSNLNTDFGISTPTPNYNPPVIPNGMSVIPQRLFAPQSTNMPPLSHTPSRMRPGPDINMNDTNPTSGRVNHIATPDKMDLDTKPESPRVEKLPKYPCLTNMTISHHSSGGSQEISAIDLQQPLRCFLRSVPFGVSMVKIEIVCNIADGDTLTFSGRYDGRPVHAVFSNDRASYEMPLRRGEKSTFEVCATVQRPSSTRVGVAQFKQFVYLDIFRPYD